MWEFYNWNEASSGRGTNSTIVEVKICGRLHGVTVLGFLFLVQLAEAQLVKVTTISKVYITYRTEKAFGRYLRPHSCSHFYVFSFSPTPSQTWRPILQHDRHYKQKQPESPHPPRRRSRSQTRPLHRQTGQLGQEPWLWATTAPLLMYGSEDIP